MPVLLLNTTPLPPTSADAPSRPAPAAGPLRTLLRRLRPRTRRSTSPESAEPDTSGPAPVPYREYLRR